MGGVTLEVPVFELVDATESKHEVLRGIDVSLAKNRRTFTDVQIDGLADSRRFHQGRGIVRSRSTCGRLR